METPKFSNVIVEKVFDAREGKNQEYCTLQLRAVDEREGTNNLQSALLGGNSKENRVAYQTIRKDIVKKYAIVEGSNLGEVMGRNLRLTVTERLTPELGYQEKVNNKDQQIPITCKGEQIYRKVELTEWDKVDTLLANDPIQIPAKTDIKNVVATEFDKIKK